MSGPYRKRSLVRIRNRNTALTRERQFKQPYMLRQLFFVVLAFISGYLVAIIFDFTSLSNWINKQVLGTAVRSVPGPQPVVKTTATTKSKFEFYTLLEKDQNTKKPVIENNEQQNITIKAPEIINQSSIPVATTATIPVITNHDITVVEKHIEALPILVQQAPSSSYLLQVASFTSKNEAERMKAVMALKGFNMMISAVQKQNRSWFRVVLGPFHSRVEAEKMQLAIARSQHIMGMIKKIDN